MAGEATERTPLVGEQGRRQSTTAEATSLLASDTVGSPHDVRRSSVFSKNTADEEESDLQDHDASAINSSASVARIVSVLLIGGFISNADGSLLMATHPVIASEFNALDDSSWLLTSFALASVATLPLYGKLSDIYGRKPLLIVAYLLFAIGLVLVGVGRNMATLIAGRVVSGAGASGMTALVSILITDLVPLREVASWRAYVNVVATTGRSIGGPLGGWLADTVGWRWSFLGQVPFAAIAIILVWLTLPADKAIASNPNESHKEKFVRIDFLGSFLMTLAILAILVPLEIAGTKIPWSHPLIIGLLVSGVVLGGSFLASQAYIAREPILPIELLKKRDVLASIIIMFCQASAQIGLMFAVPLYFQITAHASATLAGAHLAPAVIGNAIGGILSGIIIKRSGRYKSLTLVATLVAALSYTLLILRWHGHTNWFESLYIVGGGFGTGIAQSALFIALQAGVDRSDMAVAASALYLSAGVGFVSGMAGVAAVLAKGVRVGLGRRLGRLGFDGVESTKIIHKALSDIEYIDHAKPKVARAVVASYVEALGWTHGLSLAFSLIAFVVTLFIRQRKL
ncbi:MFS general substrate transporter [Lophiostoma macrostomum CBS 122681]|uniref:MFS general substrate transporter n=1 Tax=Lophiostoma macrostomum CBS 122681 TaxID=1314788 RepID=A0A6A6TN10_9PLEO|nr:MFS general substrate transporter [Lophiostoma macrostomum CBS 122681]